eukprot:s3005_g5.t1
MAGIVALPTLLRQGTDLVAQAFPKPWAAHAGARHLGGLACPKRRPAHSFWPLAGWLSGGTRARWPPQNLVSDMKSYRQKDLNLMQKAPAWHIAARASNDARIATKWRFWEGDDVGCLVGLFRRLLPAFPRSGPTVPGARYVPCGHLATLDEIEQDVRLQAKLDRSARTFEAGASCGVAQPRETRT